MKSQQNLIYPKFLAYKFGPNLGCAKSGVLHLPSLPYRIPSGEHRTRAD
jgi:hypothetical protein